MAKTKDQKKEILRDLKDKISRSKSIIFAKFNGLTVAEDNDIRKKMRTDNNEYYVAKKTLLNKALKDCGIDGLDAKAFDGKVAAVFGYGDEVSPAKLIDDFRGKNQDKMDFVGGIMDGKLLSVDEINTLAKLPGRQELYAAIVGSLNAPISGLVNVLAANMRNFLFALSAIKEKKT